MYSIRSELTDGCVELSIIIIIIIFALVPWPMQDGNRLGPMQYLIRPLERKSSKSEWAGVGK